MNDAARKTGRRLPPGLSRTSPALGNEEYRLGQRAGFKTLMKGEPSRRWDHVRAEGARGKAARSQLTPHTDAQTRKMLRAAMDESIERLEWVLKRKELQE